MKTEIYKVASNTEPPKLAGFIAKSIREDKEKRIELQCIGAGAVNQALKAVAIARGFVAPGGIDLISIPAFTDIQIEGEKRTSVKVIVEER